MKTKRIKAMRWLEPDGGFYTLPADAESYERMVVQVATGLYRHDDPEGAKKWPNLVSLSAARAALSAIGITRPKDKRK